MKYNSQPNDGQSYDSSQSNDGQSYESNNERELEPLRQPCHRRLHQPQPLRPLLCQTRHHRLREPQQLQPLRQPRHRRISQLPQLRPIRQPRHERLRQPQLLQSLCQPRHRRLRQHNSFDHFVSHAIDKCASYNSFNNFVKHAIFDLPGSIRDPLSPPRRPNPTVTNTSIANRSSYDVQSNAYDSCNCHLPILRRPNSTMAESTVNSNGLYCTMTIRWLPAAPRMKLWK